MFFTGITETFNAAHYLTGDFGEESKAHSHPYRIEWSVAKKTLDSNGFSVDIALLKELLADLLRTIDGKLLNEMPFFKDRQPSLENTALFIFTELNTRLKQHGMDPETFAGMEVKIWESADAWASYQSP